MSTVAIFSGGLDSAVMLTALADRVSGNVVALSFDYGQRHSKELAYAEAFARSLGVRHEVADLRGIRHLIGSSSQTSPNIAVPEGHYAEESMKLTVVPNRNMIMLSVAIGFAVSLRYNAVSYGAHAGDHAIYPDCRPEFVAAMNQVAALCDWHRVELRAPFLGYSKADIVTLGASLGVPFADTWSCYKGGAVHCGRCGTCVERHEAFAIAGVVDPTVYEP